jgi:hypothetical protein
VRTVLRAVLVGAVSAFLLGLVVAKPEPEPVALPLIGGQLVRTGVVIGATADQVDAVPVPVPVPGSRSCPALDPDRDGVPCNV